ncbi:hypothetical protein [Thermus sp.]|uniref:hypothetical protein n=1 Tax=Thermus sp. TaxID=275 RepID=UPI00307E8172
MRNLGRLWVLLAFLFTTALAQLGLDLKGFKVQVKEGKEVLVEALEVAPGDVVAWRLLAENKGKDPLRQVALVIPIPKETVFLEAPVLLFKGVQIRPEFSFDGGKTFGFPPLKKRVRVVEGGKEVEKEVEVRPEEYTHVRYLIPELKPGEQVEVLVRTKVR